jgi:hypothetical protein
MQEPEQAWKLNLQIKISFVKNLRADCIKNILYYSLLPPQKSMGM